MCKGRAHGAEAGLDGKQCGMSRRVTPSVQSRHSLDSLHRITAKSIRYRL